MLRCPGLAQDFRETHHPNFALQSFGFRGIFEHRQAVGANDRQDIRIDVVGFPDSYPRRAFHATSQIIGTEITCCQRLRELDYDGIITSTSKLLRHTLFWISIALFRFVLCY
jgi:hypothetical protein